MSKGCSPEGFDFAFDAETCVAGRSPLDDCEIAPPPKPVVALRLVQGPFYCLKGSCAGGNQLLSQLLTCIHSRLVRQPVKKSDTLSSVSRLYGCLTRKRVGFNSVFGLILTKLMATLFMREESASISSVDSRNVDMRNATFRDRRSGEPKASSVGIVALARSSRERAAEGD